MFEFLKKDTGQAPPDVGEEDTFDKENVGEESKEEAVKTLDKISEKKDVTPSETLSTENSKITNYVSQLEVEKIKGRIESVVEWINQFYERFSYVSESIGELRAMNISTEKKILDATKDAEKMIDIVKEVKPEVLRLDYQRTDMRMRTFEEKVAGNRQFMDEIMKEIENIKRNTEIFVGTDALMKLNEDTKKDLIEMQKINTKTKMQADKSQEIFMELKVGFADFQKSVAIIDNFNSSYSGLKEEIERVKLDHETVVSYATFGDFKKTFGNKLAVLDGMVEDLENIKKNNEVIGKTMENLFSVVRRNKEDIGDVAIKSGNINVKSIEEYNNQIIELLDIVNILTIQVAELKKGIETEKNISLKKKITPSYNTSFSTKKIKIKKKLSNDKISSDVKIIPSVKKNILQEQKNIPEKTENENSKNIAEKIIEPKQNKKEYIKPVSLESKIDKLKEGNMKNKKSEKKISP